MKPTLQMLRQRLTACHDTVEITECVRRDARRLLNADGVTIVLREGNDCLYVDEDAIAPLWKGRRFPMASCISGWSMLNRTTVIIPDVYADARVPLDAYQPTFVKSLIMAPMRMSNPIGAIGAYWAQRRDHTEAQLILLQDVAELTGEALAKVR